MNRTDIEQGVLALLRSAHEIGLPKDQLEDMESLADAGEPGVALENFCTQLDEYNLELPEDMLADTVKFCTAMGLADRYWQRLKARR